MQLQRLDGILSDLRRIGRRYREELADEANLRFAPNNDPEGDCGVMVAFQFDNEKQARQFAGSEGVNGTLPIDTDRHVYSNWAPVLEHRIGHHPLMNPFNFEANQNLRTEYSADMCPKTLDILSRSVYLGQHCDWNDEEVDAKINACRKAAREL